MTATRQQLSNVVSFGHIEVKSSTYAATKRFIKSLFGFNYLAAGIVAAFCVHEIVFGVGAMVHPVWNFGSYNWLPLIAQLSATAIIGSLAYSLLPKVAHKFLNLTLGSALLLVLSQFGAAFKSLATFLTGLGAPLKKQRYHNQHS